MLYHFASELRESMKHMLDYLMITECISFLHCNEVIVLLIAQHVEGLWRTIQHVISINCNDSFCFTSHQILLYVLR